MNKTCLNCKKAAQGCAICKKLGGFGIVIGCRDFIGNDEEIEEETTRERLLAIVKEERELCEGMTHDHFIIRVLERMCEDVAVIIDEMLKKNTNKPLENRKDEDE